MISENLDLYQLALANRILSNEGVVDAFGHVSMRHPVHSDRFLISVALPPEVIEVNDIVEVSIDGTATTSAGRQLYAENVIHSEIYRARPDIMAICHHHAPDLLPYCITHEPLVPVFQLGGVLGRRVARWDSQDEFGDTNLLLTRREEGESLARALGPDWLVLMKHHGATVVGTSLEEVVFRSVYGALNARLLTKARQFGDVPGLSEGEEERCAKLSPGAIARHWQYAVARLARTHGTPSKTSSRSTIPKKVQ